MVSISKDEQVTDEVLSAHYCLEKVDKVPGDPETTEFKRRARLHQGLWREAKGLEIGSQPIRPKPGQPSRLLGSRIAWDVAWETGANFLNKATRGAVKDRIANRQPHQTLNKDRLYCDLLSSMPMCFNLFGELQADINLADSAVHRWWPDVPGRVTAVLFEWSPGRRLKGQYLENRSAFDVAFILELDNGAQGVLGVETKYHEHCKKEKHPPDERYARYREVSAVTGIIAIDAIDKVAGTELQQIWLDHLLAASMTIHSSNCWNWAGFVLVHPAGNQSYGRAAKRYMDCLNKRDSVYVSTLESLLAADALPRKSARAFQERYLW